MAELHDLLERATDDLDPDVGALVREGRERGRRARTRRRRGAAAGAVAVAGLIGTVGWLVSTGPNTDRGTSLGPDRAAVSPASGIRHLPAPAEVSRLLGQRLPEGTAAPITTWGRPGEFAAAAWSLDTPGPVGPRRVTVVVERTKAGHGKHGAPSPMSQADLSGLARRAEGPRHLVTCDRSNAWCRELPDGSLLATYTMARSEGHGSPSVVGECADLFTPDGFHIAATAYNALGRRGDTRTGAAPVLSRQQLAAIVRDPHWLR